MKSCFLSAAMALLVLAGAAADSMEGWGEQRLVTVPASGSFNGAPFECSVKLRERAARHLLFDVSFPSPVKSDFEPNNRVPGELFVPLAMEGAGRFPAIACLHILNGNYELERMMCARLAQHGVVALFFKQPYYGERGGETGKARLASNADIFLQGLTQGLQDTRRALDLLQALPGVDSDRLGITGISMGAFLAASTCGMDQRIHKAALLLGGCDVRGILMEARETRKLRAFVEGLEPAARERLLQGLDRIDPLAAAPALAKLASSDRLRMTNAELDQVVPPASTRRLAEAIGFADRVVWLKGLDHYTAMAALPQIMESTVAFFGSDAPQAWQPPANSEKSASELLGSFLAGLVAFLNSEPVDGQAHLAGVEAETVVGGKEYRVKFDLARGAQGKFKLAGFFPEVGNAGLGRGEAPWMIGAGKKVFYGSAAARAEASLAAMIAQERLMKFRVFAGALAVAALSPDALKQYFTLGEVRRANGERVVEVRIDYKKTKGNLDLVFSSDGTPLNAVWDVEGVRGKARFSHWRLNVVADERIFEPPGELPRQAVDQEDVLRMFAAAYEYVMEAME